MDQTTYDRAANRRRKRRRALVAILLSASLATFGAGAMSLAVFTVAAAIFFHNQFADQNQLIHFLKNIAIAGGLLQVAAFGAGRFSLDSRRAVAA